MKNLLSRLTCRLRGHRAPQSVSVVRNSLFIRASVCPRCCVVFDQQVGPRAARRRVARERVRLS